MLLPERIVASTKRGIFDIVGKLSNSLFGTATEEQLNTVETHIAQIAATVKAQSGLVGKALEDMKSLSRIMNQRLDNMVQLIRLNPLNDIVHELAHDRHTQNLEIG